ncbi:VanW family protein [Gorillibacterium massiliense]|uniref:VanW family protein n=1 Tax=Gorillibacterium massiliense TaxID=1280390 RepID=UPI000693B34F|nr:VanW family protein [Gorillibacterium massiliense]
MRTFIRKWPAAYRLRVAQLRVQRGFRNQFVRFALVRREEAFPYPVKKHQSLLRRKLGASDPVLQDNKVVNLGIAVSKVNGVIIEPGETFSFWRLIGKPTGKAGYLDGLLLSHGEVKSGVGGGLCQLANLFYWMTLHTPLTVVERHHHSFDPFPDDRRVLPFGSGASVFYNYIDLRFHNPTPHRFHFRVWLTDQHLKGEVTCDSDLPAAYHLEERNHRFHRKPEGNFRENEIWRKVIDKRIGALIREELLIRNYAEVKYALPDEQVEQSEQEAAVKELQPMDAACGEE